MIIKSAVNQVAGGLNVEKASTDRRFSELKVLLNTPKVDESRIKPALNFNWGSHNFRWQRVLMRNETPHPRDEFQGHTVLFKNRNTT